MPQARLAALSVAFCLIAATASVAQPTTRPGGDDARLGGRGGRYLQRLIDEVERLDLDDAQRQSLRRQGEDLRADLRAIAELHQGNAEARAAASRERLGRFRRDAFALLDEDQRAELADALQRMRQRGDERDPNREQMTADRNRRPSMAGPAEPFAPEPAADAAKPARFADRARQRAIDTATLPTDLRLHTATGSDLAASAVLAEHRPTVFVFGSWTAPSFRDRVADLPWLVDALASPSGRSADLVVVYTAERHPAGSWPSPRNEAESVSIPAHADVDARVEAAKFVRDRLPDRPGVTLVLDAMDGSLLELASGGLDGEGDWALVVRPDGTITSRQRWFDPTAVPALVAAAAE